MDTQEAGKEIRRSVDTGSVLFGARESEYAMMRGEGLLLVIAQKMPEKTSEKLKHIAAVAGVPVYSFAESGIELGSVCGKPFLISSLLVTDAGKSNVMELGKTLSTSENTSAGSTKPKRGRKKSEEN